MTTVAVVGPPAAGVTSLAAVLRGLLPDAEVTEDPHGAAVAVLAASAIARPTDSDRAVFDEAVAVAGAVVGAVTKVDAHRCWRDVQANLSELYPNVRWIGSAAAPHLGRAEVAGVAAAVRDRLAGRAARVGELRARRAALVHARAGVRPVRTGLQRERLELGRYTRECCARLRAEFRSAAAEMPRRSAGAVVARLRDAADAVTRDVDARVGRRLADLADDADAPAPHTGPPPAPPVWDGPPVVSRRAERGLTLALGAGFGLGIAVAAGRVMAAMTPSSSVVAQAVGALVGLTLTVWLVSTRELLHDRAVVDRWVCDVVGALRGHLDDVVAARLLDAEAHFGAVTAARAAADADALTRRIAAIDAELRAPPDRSGPIRGI